MYNFEKNKGKNMDDTPKLNICYLPLLYAALEKVLNPEIEIPLVAIEYHTITINLSDILDKKSESEVDDNFSKNWRIGKINFFLSGLKAMKV